MSFLRFSLAPGTSDTHTQLSPFKRCGPWTNSHSPYVLCSFPKVGIDIFSLTFSLYFSRLVVTSTFSKENISQTDGTPIGRPGQPIEVATCCIFLVRLRNPPKSQASSDSSLPFRFLTGFARRFLRHRTDHSLQRWNSLLEDYEAKGRSRFAIFKV